MSRCRVAQCLPRLRIFNFGPALAVLSYDVVQRAACLDGFSGYPKQKKYASSTQHTFFLFLRSFSAAWRA